jgi:hypothetical protein
MLIQFRVSQNVVFLKDPCSGVVVVVVVVVVVAAM